MSALVHYSPMEIFSDMQRDGLRYIDAANSGGYRPTAEQVDEWVFRRGRRPAQRGPLIEPAKPPSVISGPISSILADHMGAMGEKFQSYTEVMRNQLLAAMPEFNVMDWLVSTQGTPAKYGPGKPAETYIQHMIRMSWLASDEAGGLRLTLLGRALLRDDALTNQADDEASVLVLEAKSELSYAQLVGHIADCGDAFVIDPYGKADHVWRLLMNTTTERVLIGPNLKKKELATLRQLLTVDTRKIEVRQAKAGVLHDRFIISDQGVHQIGASWNGVGKTLTTLFKHPQVSAEKIIEAAEEWWSSATPVEPFEPPPPESADPG